MANNLLITIDDIREYRPVSMLDAKRVDPYILEAQENDLRPVLGDALYFDFLANIDTTKYRDLLNGKTYTINSNSVDFPGIKPMLCYYSLARIVINNPLNITSYGVVQKTVNESQPVDSSTLGRLVTELRSVALSYQNRLKDFLSYNLTTYTLYNSRTTSETNSTGLNFFSA